MGKRQTISDQVRAAVDASGRSRYRISRDIGVAEATMSRFMARKNGLSMAVLDKLGELLGLDVVVANGVANGDATAGRGRARRTGRPA